MSMSYTRYWLLVLAFFIAHPALSQDILYQETFPFSGLSTDPQRQDKELRLQGWCGGNAGDEFCNNPPGTVANNGGEGAISVSAGSTVTPSQNINNNPQGTANPDSFAFFSQTGIGADKFLYTNEYSLQSIQLTSVQWDQRDSDDVPMHLAFRIGNDWYISDNSWSITDGQNWSSITADLSSLTFFVIAGDPTTLPDGGVPVSPGGLSLPVGEINAFGVWWDEAKGATSRIDNFILRGNELPSPGVPEPIPTLSEWALVLMAIVLAGLALVNLNRRRSA